MCASALPLSQSEGQHKQRHAEHQCVGAKATTSGTNAPIIGATISKAPSLYQTATAAAMLCI
jgi:hypothetical protein